MACARIFRGKLSYKKKFNAETRVDRPKHSFFVSSLQYFNVGNTVDRPKHAFSLAIIIIPITFARFVDEIPNFVFGTALSRVKKTGEFFS